MGKTISVEFLAKTFRDNSSDDLKKRILNVLEVVQRDIPVSRPSGKKIKLYLITLYLNHF